MVEVIEEKSMIMYIVGILNSGPLKIKLILRGLKHRVEMFLIALKITSLEEHNDERSSRPYRSKERSSNDHDDRKEASKRNKTNQPRTNYQRVDNVRQLEFYTPLNTTREHIMNILKRTNQL